MPRYSEATLAAIKNAINIVDYVGENLQVTRAGSKFKALCPFHDDHNPSLELNPERQSYKCWSCGAGGDVFDFVKEYERVEFPEAVRILAERAGVALESQATALSSPSGPSKTELMTVNAWAEGAFQEALSCSEPARAYVAARGIEAASVTRFKLGYAPGERGWLVGRAKRAGYPVELLERAGLVTRPAAAPGVVRQRFSGRLIFPIHDGRGRVLGFGGRVLPEVERFLAASGKNVAKYLNSPETPLFQKRRVLYASDLARAAAREAGWVAVVEGYTDVIAAHQVGLGNVVGTLGTALGEDHVSALRRLADRVILIFDGDNAGQNAADRALEIFLGHEVDVRVLTLPENLDPCDFLLRDGAEAFRALVARAVDPLAFALRRAEARFEVGSIEGSRLAAEWLLSIFASVPATAGGAVSVKVDKAVDALSHALRLTKNELNLRLRQIRRVAAARPARPWSPPNANPAAMTIPAPAPAGPVPIPGVADAPAATEAGVAVATKPRTRHLRPTDLDPTDRELVQILLTEPRAVGLVVPRVSDDRLVDENLKAIFEACVSLHRDGIETSFEKVALRLEKPELRSLAAGLLLPYDPAPMPEVSSNSLDVEPAPWEVRLTGILAKIAERDRQNRLRQLKGALEETNQADDPSTYQALRTEYFRLLNQRPDTKTKTAS